ncbi:hypothetical protein XA68_11383 [Ophiocordyceps unilateralis]|uniref:Uncharacterized protein n=1 Tax=Ophiocordyceps unilateralis TaxID=268505 RepID=A0A2A9PGJ1_OPHUN|nr:hypothetical protein XA68_11383 [Ophiocordyceps unilateralis]
MVATRKSARSEIRSARRQNPGRTSRSLPRRRPQPSCPSSYSDQTESDHDADFQLIDDASAILTANSTCFRNQRVRKRRSRLANVEFNAKVSPGSGPSREGGSKSGRSSQEPPAKSRKLSKEQGSDESTSVIPDWKDPRISFDCWTDIFFYAASSVATDDLATNWLIQAATSCRALSEPALTALYRCPPVRTSSKARRLAALLERPPSETLYNYRAKVEALHINIQLVPQAVLYQLIHPLRRLKELLIFTPMDQPPYRELDKNLRWHYTEDIFRSLAPAEVDSSEVHVKPYPTLLESWEWSGRFIGGCVPTAVSMASIHDTTSFSSLTKLSFTNLQLPSLSNLRLKPDSDEEELRAYHEDGRVIEDVAHAISRLKYLNHLVFESSTVMNDRLLPLLPKNLAHLELINCWEVKSEDLAEFLGTHGSKLRTLVLLHNQSLDLAFLTTLSETCPGLRELHINLSYYRHHECVNDADPMYDQALLPSQVPKWPSSLRVLSVEHIRNWSVEAAEVFFRSLINSAGDLPNLRHLAIKTRLDIPWQARATMRREWRATMEKVFLRPVASPRPQASLRAPIMNDVDLPAPKKRSARTAASPPPRRSGRIAAHVGCRTSAANKRLCRQQGKPSYRDPDTDEDEDEAELTEEDDDAEADNVTAADADGEEGELIIQGLCDTVNLQFDNQKVRELQYGMEDFLDEDKAETEDEWEEDDEEDESVVVFH